MPHLSGMCLLVCLHMWVCVQYEAFSGYYTVAVCLRLYEGVVVVWIVGGGRVMIFTSATGSSLHPYISLLLSSPAPLCSSLLLARSLQSLASELTTIQRAINHPDKSVSIAWLGRHENAEEEVGGGSGGRGGWESVSEVAIRVTGAQRVCVVGEEERERMERQRRRRWGVRPA